MLTLCIEEGKVYIISSPKEKNKKAMSVYEMDLSSCSENGVSFDKWHLRFFCRSIKPGVYSKSVGLSAHLQSK